MNKEEILAKIVKYFDTRDEVACAYLFGSFGTEYFNEGFSDIDIAVILRDDTKYKYDYDLESMKIDLEEILQCEVDVCDMHFLAKMITRDVYVRDECFYGQDTEERMEMIDKFNYWAEENYRILHLIEIEQEEYFEERMEEIRNGSKK